MKKITKLINGSVVVFILCLMAVLTLTSCNNIQGDEYKVTEEEFIYAVNLNNFDNFRVEAHDNETKSTISVDCYVENVDGQKYNHCKIIDNEGKESSLSNITDLNQFGLVDEVDYDKLYNELVYDEKNKEYKVHYDFGEKENYYLDYVFKFKSKKLKRLDYKRTSLDGNVTLNYYTIYKYDCVEPF